MIGLPPVLNFCNDNALRDRVARECFSGEKAICLAISEAFAGSDVAGIRTTAVKSKCGQFYIVNGTKKWITNGMWSDYFTTAVRTEKGFSVLLIERGEGVETEVWLILSRIALQRILTLSSKSKLPTPPPLAQHSSPLTTSKSQSAISWGRKTRVSPSSCPTSTTSAGSCAVLQSLCLALWLRNASNGQTSGRSLGNV